MDGQEVGPEQQQDDDPFAPAVEPEPSYVKEKTYWAKWKGDDLIDALKEKTRDFYEAARLQGLLDRWIISYAFHHGTTPDDLRELATMVVNFTGAELERVRFHINLNRSYNRHSAIMALGEKPAFKAKTLNNDQRSLAKAELSDKIVNGLYGRYYEKYDAPVAEGEGFAGACGTHTKWDFKSGDEVTVDAPSKRPVIDPNTGQPATDGQGNQLLTDMTDEQGNPVTHPVQTVSGAPQVSVFYPWNKVIETQTTANGDDLWTIIREPDNKWNVIAQFGEEYTDDVLAQEPGFNDEYSFWRLFNLQALESRNKDTLIVQHFYHARCPAMPDGRYVVFVGDVMLWDGPCPTKEGLPISEMCSSKWVETVFPFADSWDIVSLCQALNQCTSDELQNLSLFGRQTTYGWKGSGVTGSGLTKGTHYDLPPDSKPPGAVMLAQMPPTQEFKSYVLQMMDRMMGQNGTTRGEPDANVRSGEMAALLDSISIRYQSFRQQAARRYRIRNAQIIVDMIARYGETQFLVDIAGVEDRSYVMSFTKDDLQGVQRIDMDVVSPMMQTVSGRLQWMKELLAIQNPQDRAGAYDFVVNGDPDTFLFRDRSGRELVRRENERLITGSDDVQPSVTDNPFIHVPMHQAAIDRLLSADEPDMAAVNRVRMHMLMHQSTYLMDAQPLMCQQLGFQPPPAIGPTQQQMQQAQFDPSTPMGNAAWRFQLQVQGGAPIVPPVAPLAPNGAQLNQGAPGQPPPNQAAGAPTSLGAPSDPSSPGTSGTPQTDHPGTGTPMPQPSQPPPQAGAQA